MSDETNQAHSFLKTHTHTHTHKFIQQHNEDAISLKKNPELIQNDLNSRHKNYHKKIKTWRLNTCHCKGSKCGIEIHMYNNTVAFKSQNTNHNNKRQMIITSPFASAVCCRIAWNSKQPFNFSLFLQNILSQLAPQISEMKSRSFETHWQKALSQQRRRTWASWLGTPATTCPSSFWVTWTTR